jgi:RHS repeat-associated protein
MSNTRNQCDGVGNATKPAMGLDRDFAQLTQSYQAHDGEVNTGTTPKVQYSYADGSSNTIRITGMTYPNGRNLVDDYGTTGGMNDAASRIFGMKDSGASSNLVEYSYLGLSGFVRTVYPESSAQYTLIGTTGGTNPDSGDIYLGLDRFGRVINANCANVAGTATLARVKYGYNRVSSRTWRDNLSPGMTGYDELYGYDQLQRLQTLGRGTLNGTQTAITSPTFGQDWTLDETGNWNGFKQDNTGSGTWNLDQTRTANTVNEINSLVNETSKAWTTPAYDKAGNMTRIPVPGTLPDGVAWNTMSLSDWDNLKLTDWEEMTLNNVEGVYDAWNRLVRLHVGDTTLAEYTYDARGYRIRKDNYTDGTLTDARHYYYTPGWQVVEERVGTSTSANRQFVWGLRYIDDLVLRDRDTDGNGTLDERRYCLQDGNWNTIALTSTSGIVTERFSYDVYGVPTFLTSTGTLEAASPTGWETLYAGYRWDGDPSRMYYVRNRLLLPCLGTWNRRDPIGYLSANTNLGIYLGNNVPNLVDPTGLMPNRRNLWNGMMLVERISAIESQYPDYTPEQVLGEFLSQIKRDEFADVGSWSYVYTLNAGFIDTAHFFESAGYASREDVRGSLGGMTANAVYAGGIAVEINQYGQQALHDYVMSIHKQFSPVLPDSINSSSKELNGLYNWISRPLRGLGSSAFTPEDLPSDWHGSVFGANMRPDIPLSIQVFEYYSNTLNALPPGLFPYLDTLPETEREWESWFQINDPRRLAAFRALQKPLPEHTRTMYQWLYYPKPCNSAASARTPALIGNKSCLK